jgi:hypothetical protein
MLSFFYLFSSFFPNKRDQFISNRDKVDLMEPLVLFESPPLFTCDTFSQQYFLKEKNVKKWKRLFKFETGNSLRIKLLF